MNDIVPRYKDSFWNTKDMIPGEQAIIRVSDTGIGMEKAVLPTIFKRFHQVQNNTGKQHTGSGIGLSLVKSLIELHHGGIIISSKPDAGTEVIIALPISDTYLAKEEKIEESTFVLKDYLSNYAVDRRDHSYLYGRQTYDSAGGRQPRNTYDIKGVFRKRL